MKLTLALDLIILLIVQTTLSDKPQHFHDTVPHRTTVSQPSYYADGSSSGKLQVSFPPGSIFPCPTPDDIHSCTCSHSGEDLSLDCSSAIADSQLQHIFEQYFPVKYFLKFEMNSNAGVKQLNQTHDIRFKKLHITNGALESVSYNFLESSANHLREVYIVGPPLTDFPLSQLNTLFGLESLTISINLVTLGKLVSRKLNYIALSSNISSINSDTFRDVPKLRNLSVGPDITTLKTRSIPIRSGMESVSFSSNPLTSIEPGAFYDGSNDRTSAGFKRLECVHCRLNSLEAETIPLTQLTEEIDLTFNNISSISPGAFFILSEPKLDSITIRLERSPLTTIDESVFGGIMKYIKSLYLWSCPIACSSCEIAWIVSDPSLQQKITISTCHLSDLQPEDFSHC